MLKGLVLKYPFLLLVAVVFILIVSRFVQNIFMKTKIPEAESKIDVEYACSVYNNSLIDYEELSVVLYGFKTEQCNYFVATLEENVSLRDIERVVGRDAIRLNECVLPKVNSGSLYIVTDSEKFEEETTIVVMRRKIRNGDIIICESET